MIGRSAHSCPKNFMASRDLLPTSVGGGGCKKKKEPLLRAERELLLKKLNLRRGLRNHAVVVEVEVGATATVITCEI